MRSSDACKVSLQTPHTNWPANWNCITNVLFIVFKLVGFYTQVEYHTSRGRVDLVLKTNDYIYVMEFKLEGTAQEALKQINEKQYALPFASDPRKLFKIGINFSNRLRNIEEWIIEE